MKLFKTNEPAPEPALPTVDEMTDILDIEEIFSFPWDEVFLISGITLLILILLVVAYYLIRWWFRRRALENRDELLPPHEKVFLELERLEKQKFLERGDFRKYFYFLSEIFRRYLFERFGYPALEKTTYEISPDFNLRMGLPDELGSMAKSFLNNADLVKFGNYEPGKRIAQKEKGKIVKFVNATIPVEPEPEEQRQKSEV